MRIVIEALGHQLVVGLNALEPEPAAAAGYAADARDPGSTLSSQVERSYECPDAPFGFAPVHARD